MTSVITQRANRKKYIISSGWSKVASRKFVNSTRKSGLFATTLNSKQARKIRMLARNRRITNRLIRSVKRI